jgi:hypothetical protein
VIFQRRVEANAARAQPRIANRLHRNSHPV